MRVRKNIASRARQIARTEGTGRAAYRGVRYGIRRLNQVRARRRIEEASVAALDPDAALDFVFGMRFGDVTITSLQVRSEIHALLGVLRAHPPKTVIEIGTAQGGTLFLLASIAAPDALLISVDMPGGPYGGGYSPERISLYQAFARAQQRIVLIRGDSGHADTLDDVRRALAGASADVLFIDGDHRYDGVSRDFRLYTPLVRSGGVVALHDIASHRDPTIGVQRFWDELKTQFPQTFELIEDEYQAWAGIGLVVLAESGEGPWTERAREVAAQFAAMTPKATRFP
jgi:predicted O-methyltransferase YrrM